MSEKNALKPFGVLIGLLLFCEMRGNWICVPMYKYVYVRLSLNNVYSGCQLSVNKSKPKGF